MAEPSEGTGDGRRLTLSERTVREIVENAILKLQLELTKTFASPADVTRLEDALKGAVSAADLRFKAVEEKTENLERDKAGRDAVTQFKKWLTGGALLATLFMAIQVVLTIWLMTHHGAAPTTVP